MRGVPASSSACDYIDDTWRQTRFEDDFSQAKTGQWCQGRWLENTRISGCQGGSQTSGRNLQGIIPWNNDGHHSHRLIQCVVKSLRGYGDLLACEAISKRRIKTKTTCSPRQIIFFYVAYRISGVERLQTSQDEVSDLFKQLNSLLNFQFAPGGVVKCASRRPYGAIYVFGRTTGHLGESFVVARTGDFKSLTAFRITIFSIDE